MSDQAKLWWQKPLRVIQPNLQVRDTHLIDPEKLAGQIQAMGGNTIVFNVGGIYAWYRTEVAFHNENEFLPSEDLLKQVIEACHEKNIKFIARFDFSKADDRIYLHRPQWFAKDHLGEPKIIGSKRPGTWSLLMSTCINGAYRNEAVAMPVLDEVMTKYDVDGIFFNAPGFVPCYCEACRRKYAQRYGKELPKEPENYETSWASSCLRDNMEKLYALIKGKRPDIAMILYYNLYRDNLFDRERTTDMLCTEPQDVLSLGHKQIPEFWKPALSIKLGRSLPQRPRPFGIVHSSPGMDWRHTGLPPAEYLFWLSQIPAHGGQIWHSLTGIPDTIGDKRILNTVTALNHMAEKIEAYMDGAVSLSQAALMWNADRSAEGWADGLINKQIPFDVLLDEQATVERLMQYKVVVIPENFHFTPAFVEQLGEYVRQGGNAIIEGNIPSEFETLLQVAGIQAGGYESQPLIASYLRFEGERNPLQNGLEQTELIAHRGRVWHCEPREGAAVLATLVPPFSPLESVGAPPERASLPVSRTDLPLGILNRHGQGKALYLPFSLSYLINEYKLEEHYCLLSNAINMMLDGDKAIEVTHYPGLQVTAFKNNGNTIIHLVNGAGRRPLSANIPLHDITLKVRLANDQEIRQVERIISGEEAPYQVKEGYIEIRIPQLKVWDALLIEAERSASKPE